MDLANLIGTHGYWVLFVGCLLEGETLLVLAGFAAHRGYLDLGVVIGLASAAGFAGDQGYFWLGRQHGAAVFARFQSIGRQAKRVQRLVERYPRLSVVGVRFAYGLRIAGPVLMGASDLSPLRFAAFNALGAVLWAATLATLGWTFGEAAKAILGEIRHVEGWLFLAGLGIGLLAWAVRNLRARRRG
jgi:membrane protein DedA with SNARE-associated domain